MDKSSAVENITLLFDSFNEESKNLFETFKKIGIKVNAVSIEDDGYLPDGVTSVFGYFLGDYSTAPNCLRKPLFFSQLAIPEFWEITSTNANGKILNGSKERGRIFYSKMDNSRLVKIVDWLDENGKVRISEHYNRYGAIFCKTYFNDKEQKTSRSFYDIHGREVIYHNFVTDDYVLTIDGVDTVINSKVEFVKYFLGLTGYDNTDIIYNSLSYPFFLSEALEKNGHKDYLFWNEPITDGIPGNMSIILNGNAKRTEKIYVQRSEAYKKLIELGAPKEKLCELGYVYDFARENNHSNNALIITNSDNIAKLKEIVEGVPGMHFHIAAITEMSSKLMAMDYYDNVTLYPGAKKSLIDNLFDKCDYYLDINYEGELYDAIHRAFLSNLLIFAFNETIHNKNYIAPTNILDASDVENLVMVLNNTIETPELIDMALIEQKSFALAEDADRYKNFL